MEIAVTSIVSPGDKVLALNTGYFANRMVEINRAYGASAEEIRTEFGVSADPDEVRRRLAAGKFKAVFVTHVDTSSTTCNAIKEIVKEAKNSGSLAVVDGVCSVGGLELDFDRLGADVVFTGSQKALAAPPGTVLIAVSRELLEQMEMRKDSIRGYYLNLLRWKAYMEDPVDILRLRPCSLCKRSRWLSRSLTMRGSTQGGGGITRTPRSSGRES